jgi:hypothetical protein
MGLSGRVQYAVIAIGVVATAVFADIDVVHIPLGVLNRIELHTIDDILVTLLTVVVALGADLFMAARRADHGTILGTDMEARNRLVVNTALDCVVMMDGWWNDSRRMWTLSCGTRGG